MSAHWETANGVLQREAEDATYSGKYFEYKVSKINRILKKNLPLDAHGYLITAFGKKPFTKYGLTLLPDQIAIS